MSKGEGRPYSHHVAVTGQIVGGYDHRDWNQHTWSLCWTLAVTVANWLAAIGDQYLKLRGHKSESPGAGAD